MRNKYFYFIFVAFTALGSCKKNAADSINDAEAARAKERAMLENVGFPKMTFTKSEFDFGKVEEGTIVEGTFEYTNTGESDLVITAAKASCGCTIPEYDRDKPIKTGDKGFLKFKFDTNGRTENQRKTITIFANTKNQNEEVVIKGFVTPKKRAIDRKDNYLTN